MRTAKTGPDRRLTAYERYLLKASAVPSLHRLRSHCTCGINLSLCIKKELIKIELNKEMQQKKKKKHAITVVFKFQ